MHSRTDTVLTDVHTAVHLNGDGTAYLSLIQLKLNVKRTYFSQNYLFLNPDQPTVSQRYLRTRISDCVVWYRVVSHRRSLHKTQDTVLSFVSQAHIYLGNTTDLGI